MGNSHSLDVVEHMWHVVVRHGSQRAVPGHCEAVLQADGPPNKSVCETICGEISPHFSTHLHTDGKVRLASKTIYMAYPPVESLEGWLPSVRKSCHAGGLVFPIYLMCTVLLLISVVDLILFPCAVCMGWQNNVMTGAMHSLPPSLSPSFPPSLPPSLFLPLCYR